MIARIMLGSVLVSSTAGCPKPAVSDPNLLAMCASLNPPLLIPSFLEWQPCAGDLTGSGELAGGDGKWSLFSSFHGDIVVRGIRYRSDIGPSSCMFLGAASDTCGLMGGGEAESAWEVVVCGNSEVEYGYLPDGSLRLSFPGATLNIMPPHSSDHSDPAG